jgi:hypothetical protein
MRNISFALTADQVLLGDKDVTRRLGWKHAKPGQFLQGVFKSQGLRKGEKVRKLRVIRVLDARREMVEDGQHYENETAREGFPHLTWPQFEAMFCEHNRCTPQTIITRIEFEYLASPPEAE